MANHDKFRFNLADPLLMNMHSKLTASPSAPELICVLVSAALCANAADFKFPAQTFTVPDGFEVELVAGPPNVNRPIMADFDEQGRLYVADSAGLAGRSEEHVKHKENRIVRLSDTTGHGHFDESLVFADGLMFPEGVLWYDGAVYYSGVPSIWKLEDTKGDGKADRRTEWFQGKTMTGCMNDLHGPYLGPDGWIYWCKGAFAEQTHERPGRPPISDSAAHIFRCRPDGSDFDSVMSGGMDNPVEIAFTSAGEAIFTTTFYTDPAGGQRDALVHAVYGGVFPKINGVLDGLKRTGDLLPAMTHLGPAAPSGLVRYASRVFGAEYQGNLFSSQFNLHKVQRHILEPLGATYRTKDIDFMVSDNPDFHPTDVIEDADGSLLVIDTGGWYKVCCPTSQIAKPEVLGAIYRVRRTGAARVEDGRGLKLDWVGMRGGADLTPLAKLLDDLRPAVQNRAIDCLAKRGDEAIPAMIVVLKTGKSSLARLNAVWVLARIHTPRTTEGLWLAFHDADALVQQAAAHAAGLLRDPLANPLLIEALRTGGPHLKMTAAASLGQIGARTAVPFLLEAAVGPVDRFLEHALTYALIEIDDRQRTLRGLESTIPSVRRVAMIALDQMAHGDLAVTDVTPALNAPEPVLRETAVWVASHHPEWGASLTGYLEKRLLSLPAGKSERAELERQLSQLARNEAVQNLMSKLVEDNQAKSETRQLLLRAMGETRLREIPAAWAATILRVLAGEDEATISAALGSLRSLAWPKTSAAALSKAILQVAAQAERPRSDHLRLEALSTFHGSLSPVPAGVFSFLLLRLDAIRPPLERATASEILGRAKLSEDQLDGLVGMIKVAGPLELSKLLPAFDGATNEALGAKLIGALEHANGRAALRGDLLRPRLAKFSSSIRDQGEALLATLNADAPKQKQRLASLESGLAGGDRNRGQVIFSGTKAACFTCHAVGYVGGHIGPDLTRIGAIRTQRDLLEAIVYPSASFARGYEPIHIATRSGEDYSGIVRDETSDSLTLITGPTAEQRIRREEIVEMRPGTVSIMPEGFADQLSRPELADLIAFLGSLK